MTEENAFDKYSNPATWVEGKKTITNREISLVMETARDLREYAQNKYPTELRYDLKKRRELEEKAEILEKMCGMVCKC